MGHFNTACLKKSLGPSGRNGIGMDFGVRYAFDSGKCTGPGNCEADYDKSLGGNPGASAAMK